MAVISPRECVCHIFNEFDRVLPIVTACDFRSIEIEILQNALVHLRKASLEIKQCSDTGDNKHVDRLIKYGIELYRIQDALEAMVASVTIGLGHKLLPPGHRVLAAYRDVLVGYGIGMGHVLKYCLSHDMFQAVRDHLVSAQLELDRLPGSDSNFNRSAEDEPCDQHEEKKHDDQPEEKKHPSEDEPCNQPLEKKHPSEDEPFDRPAEKKV